LHFYAPGIKYEKMVLCDAIMCNIYTIVYKSKLFPEWNVENLGARLRAIRIRLDLTQGEIARKIGSSATAIGQYEKNEKVPGGKVLAGLARLGVNINWLLTGEARPVDGKLLETIIATVEGQLMQDLRVLSPETKAELLVFLYEYFEEDAAGLQRGELEGDIAEKTLRLIKFRDGGRDSGTE